MEGDSIMEAKGNMFTNNKIKVSIFLFIAVFVIYSAMFTEHVLSHIPNATTGTAVTDTGYVVQALLVTLSYIAIDFMVKNNIV